MAATGETILVTGATGYLGAHTCVALLAAGYEVVGLDNFHNSHPAVLERIAAVAGRPPRFYRTDVRDTRALGTVFAREPISGVIHFAGLKAVDDAWPEPLDMFGTNVVGTASLAEAMAQAGVRRLIFSSSATVYGQADTLPVPENAPLRPVTPYGSSKAMAEQLLRNASAGRADFSVLLLRYFNPAGAHPSGLLGEDPAGTPNNLVSLLAQAAAGRRAGVDVYGGDYPTADGTGVRDYLHVMDLARGHVDALRVTTGLPGCHAVNLGSGRGHSVLDVAAAFHQASSQSITLRRVPRRAGDVAVSWADVSLARALLGWSAGFTLHDICRDAWRWAGTWPAGFPVGGPRS